ncbi:MAG TPA: hypothetical protein VGK18_16580 [Propionicimonas sp.]|uniref:hypothetical protein n=1 Tax=Propionicimonas sp. TaxID=1955623 RepID=UPI002F404295
MTVRLTVQGHVSAELVEWLAPLEADGEAAGDTVLRGTLPDQSAFHGLCNRIRDLGLPLLELTASRKDVEP